MPQHHGSGQNRAEGIRHVLPSYWWRRAVYWLEHRRLAGMNIPTGRHTQPSLQPGGEIGDDVAEHVVGHDYIKRPRIAHQVHAERIHIHVLRRDLRMLAAHFLEHALPQAAGVGHGIRFVGHENSLTRRPVDFRVALTIFKCIADDALHAFARIDVFLNRDLIRSALFENSSGIAVAAFRALADDHEIHIFRLDTL